MPRFEYKVVPAPSKGQKAKGVKSQEGRFARAIETTLNDLAADGWEYVRAELLPSDERSGLTGSTVNWRNVLVFRRQVETDIDVLHPRPVLAPAPFDEPPIFTADPPLEAVEDSPRLSLVTEEPEEEYDDWEDESELEYDPPEDEPRR